MTLIWTLPIALIVSGLATFLKPRNCKCAISALVMIVPAANAAQEFTACKNHFSPQQQIDLGDKSKQQVQKQTPVLPDSSAATQYIQRLGEKLAASAPGYKWPYNFHIADVAEINAFALPGGSIFVNLGTIQAATTEAQLAGVMAHEISHVVLQHSVCNAEKQQRVGIFSGIGQLAAGVMLGGAVGEAAGEAIGYSTNLGFLKMSRGAERQADLEGAIIAYDTGYDPAGMAQFFQTIESKYGEGGAQFMSDHPNPGNRTEYVDKEIAEFAPKPDLITTTPEFERIKKEVAGLRTYTAKDVASGVWRSQTAQQTVNTGINQSAGPKTGSVKPNLTTSGPWKPFSGEGFSLEIPTNWKTYKNEKSTMIGPQGGIARAADGAAGNVVYGLMADRYQPESGVEGMEALKALLAEVVADNPGLVPGKQKDIMVGTLKGHSTECDNPSANEGKGEHEWVVAFQQTDGTLFYLAFVAPTADFDTLRPSFERILQSLNIQP